jgi:hypothetical protein
MVLAVLLLAMLGALVGATFGIVNLSKDTRISNSLMTSRSSSEVIATGERSFRC